jgi:hypothetical protein
MKKNQKRSGDTGKEGRWKRGSVSDAGPQGGAGEKQVGGDSQIQ